ncbi:hypothetical protein [Mucilaginibacter pedocola]|uniref:Uncharacterized protein n=1 Tax=Mucilaginibacter pedocola TaxID=1792845 RepID=A0A1S9PME5_9SPHI|nr:hypothetical protein [Mucilaginibacter pedocola]OOQ62111.1 hypothetical protein BC343_03415 [Mucilaginibacter pedocola]
MNSSIDLNLVRGNLEKLSTDRLLDILSFSQDDYNPLAVSAMQDILISRGVSQHEIDVANSGFNDLKSKIKTNQGPQRETKTVKILLWILALIAMSMMKYLTEQFSNILVK